MNVFEKFLILTLKMQRKILLNSYDNQQVGRPLILADNTDVPMFEAKDDDGGHFGDIEFEIANYGGGKYKI